MEAVLFATLTLLPSARVRYPGTAADGEPPA